MSQNSDKTSKKIVKANHTKKLIQLTQTEENFVQNMVADAV